MSRVACLLLLNLICGVNAYQTLSDNFLRDISAFESDFDPKNGSLVSPLLQQSVSSNQGKLVVQQHLVDFFSLNLPDWNITWQNSTIITAGDERILLENLIVRREPPWTKPGQANFLTLAAHYHNHHPEGQFMHVGDVAVSCALLMNTARSIDQYVSQMHAEMSALGEGGTESMDMGIQIVFFDGSPYPGIKRGSQPSGAEALSWAWERQHSLMRTSWNMLGQIRLFVLLDHLGWANMTVPSYLKTTRWAHLKMADLEVRLRNLGLLRTRSSPSLLLDRDNEFSAVVDLKGDHTPFARRGVPFVHLLPVDDAKRQLDLESSVEHFDLHTVLDWAKVISGFTLEWLDMMEVWSGD